MSEERDDKHTSVSVEMVDDNRVRISLRGKFECGQDVTENPQVSEGFVLLPTLDSANALRDALSAFITYHRNVGAKP